MQRDNFNLKYLPLFFCGLFSAMVMLAAMGCTPKYGSLQRNTEVHQTFQEFEVLPDHLYYFQGLESQPFAIAGIHQQYRLNAKLWQQFDPTAPALENLIKRLIIRYGYEPRGFFILDHDSKKIGIWYSIFYWATVQTGVDDDIIVLSPEAPASSTQR